MRSWHGFCLGLFVLGSCLAPAAHGVVLIDSAGFEAPGYSTTHAGTGALGGQAASTYTGPVNWFRAGGGAGTAVVQSSTAQAGSQAVRVTRAANSDDRWAAPVAGSAALSSVTIEWDMLVQAGAPTSDFGPFFGIEAYDSRAATIRLGMLGIDAATSEVLYTDRFSGLIPTPGGETVTLGQWNSFRIELDFSSDMYRGYVNNSQVISTQFEFTGGDVFTDADIAALAAAGNAGSLALTGVAFFDNYVVRGSLPGDFNDDGTVDAADYTTWRDGLGATYTAADYQVWRNKYGTSLSLPAGSLNAVSSPEPTALALALLAAAGLAGPRGRYCQS